jgi:hypothetical protein|nr:MAG TPA: hypothetical protein [Caudoviricetes sp.]
MDDFYAKVTQIGGLLYKSLPKYRIVFQAAEKGPSGLSRSEEASRETKEVPMIHVSEGRNA